MLEPTSKGYFQFGNETLLSKFKKSAPLQHYTLIQSKNSPLELIIDQEKYILPPNHLLALNPEQYFAVENEKPCYVIKFNKEFYCIKDHDKELNCNGILFYSNISSPKINLTHKTVTQLEMTYQEIIEEFQEEHTSRIEMIQILLKKIIIISTRLIKNQHLSGNITDNTKNDILRKFNILVETHFRKEHQVAFYADLMFKSPKTLSNYFKTLHTSPLHIIHQRLVLESKRLLTYTDKSLKEIAMELGFLDASKFSRLFKNKTNSTPLDYRKNTKKQQKE